MYPPYNNKQGYVRNIIYIWDNMDIHAFRINKGRGHGRVQVIIKHCYYLILDGVLALFHIYKLSYYLRTINPNSYLLLIFYSLWYEWIEDSPSQEGRLFRNKVISWEKPHSRVEVFNSFRPRTKLSGRKKSAREKKKCPREKVDFSRSVESEASHIVDIFDIYH